MVLSDDKQKTQKNRRYTIVTLEQKRAGNIFKMKYTIGLKDTRILTDIVRSLTMLSIFCTACIPKTSM